MISFSAENAACTAAMRPAALFQVPSARRTSSPPSLIADSMAHRLVVGRRLPAPAEQVLVLLFGRRPELERLGPVRRRCPSVLLEQAPRVPHPVHREGVVDRGELAAEGPGREHAAVQRVADRDTLQVGGVDDVGEVLELVEDRVEPDRLGTGVVDEVGRIAADEARLQLGRDLRRRARPRPSSPRGSGRRCRRRTRRSRRRSRRRRSRRRRWSSRRCRTGWLHRRQPPRSRRHRAGRSSRRQCRPCRGTARALLRRRRQQRRGGIHVGWWMPVRCCPCSCRCSHVPCREFQWMGRRPEAGRGNVPRRCRLHHVASGACHARRRILPR